ncbi:MULTISPECIES: hypothetical protein [unclassified Microcoleus]|uniref:hypothetical protein n=1 Tax=unclassified Microcoleus TaxID=2642155 RepID=UPI002FD1E4B3
MENNQEFESQQIDGKFHSVDPDSLKKITVDEILSGGGVEAEEMQYTVTLPTANDAKIHRDRSLDAKSSVFDRAPRSKFAEKRGTLGGC